MLRRNAHNGRMPTFAILRTDKHAGEKIRRALGHAFRERPVPNADPARTPDNRILAGAKSVEGAMRRMRDRLAELAVKPRRGQVEVIEYLITASPRWFKRHGGKGDERGYFAAAMEWLERRHGRENVVAAVVHLDERTPHLSAFVQPLVHRPADRVKRSVNKTGGGRRTIEVPRPERWELSAASFQGTPGLLSQLQTEFTDQVGAAFGLVRGRLRSRAKHTKIRSFYAALNRAQSAAPPLTTADHVAAVIGKQTTRMAAFERWRRSAEAAVSYALGTGPELEAQQRALAADREEAAALAAAARKAVAAAEEAERKAQRERLAAVSARAKLIKLAYSPVELCRRLKLREKGRADVFELLMDRHAKAGKPITFEDAVAAVERVAPPSCGDRYQLLANAAAEHAQALIVPVERDAAAARAAPGSRHAPS